MEENAVAAGHHLGGLTFGTFLLDALFIFFFVVWFWILIRVMMDLFRRKDIGGGAKILWVIFLVVLPYIGIFAYLLTQGWSMGERDVEQAEAARDQLRSVVGFSVADEIEKLGKLKAAGTITDAEYDTLRARLL
jgi:Short C-terminal domain/Phospholipase_D-nuclease N-terminal